MTTPPPTEPNADANTFVEKVTNALAGTNAEPVKLRVCPLCGKDASEVRCHPSGQRMVQCSDFPQNCILSRFIVPLHQWQRRHESEDLPVVELVRVCVESLGEASPVAERLRGLSCVIFYKREDGDYVQWNPESDEMKRLRDALERIARQTGPRIPSLSFNMLQDIARGALD